MRDATERFNPCALVQCFGLAVGWIALLLFLPVLARAQNQEQASISSGAAPAACTQPVYLTFDTGHMGVAPLIAEVLQRQQVRVTFFAAQEKTQEGDGSLGRHWAPWWKARVAEGHVVASHTWDHAYWRADLAADGVAQSGGAFRIRPRSGEQAGKDLVWTAQDYCNNLRRAAQRLHDITGQVPLPLFRAPGGKTSPRLLAAAKQCGFARVGWAEAGFLGHELRSTVDPTAPGAWHTAQYRPYLA